MAHTHLTGSSFRKIRPEQSTHSTAAQKCINSASSKIPRPDPYLPYETMPIKIIETLCGKEREHWKKAWEFEMYRATLKQTWKDAVEKEYTYSQRYH